MEPQTPQRQLTATVVAMFVALAAMAGCSGTSAPSAPLSLGGGLSVLVGDVPAPALEGVAGAVHLLPRSCPDLRTDSSAAKATLKAAKLAGLSANDVRWAAAGRSLTEGLAIHDPNTACADQLEAWLAAGMVPATIPISASSTTTTPPAQAPVVVTNAGVPKVSAMAFGRIETGMTIAAVRKICGSKGQTVTSTDVGRDRNDLVTWPAIGGVTAAITVQFRNGRVLAATTTGARQSAP